MTETLEKKGMTLITDSFVCRTLQFHHWNFFLRNFRDF